MRYELIARYDGFYRVGTDGSVWTCRVAGRVKKRNGEWKKKKLRLHKDGYLIVRLQKDGILKPHQVHRLVLETFVGPCPPGMEARHFPDRDPANNTIENLQWGTHLENMRDRVFQGTSSRGEQNGHAKLDAAVVLAVRKIISEKRSTVAKQARLHEVSYATISHIIHRKTWKHL